MNDFSPGHYLTYGKFDPVSSTDDWFHADVFFIWFSNPAYTRIPHQHFITEARYRGATVVTVAPDYSPSAMHADYYVGVKPGTDAAFALGMAATVIEEGLVHEDFVKDQTDLPLLVRDDNQRLLVEADLKEGGHPEQFFWLDAKTKAIAPAPRDTLKLGKVDPALTGKVSVTLKDGSKITASPVYGRVVSAAEGLHAGEGVGDLRRRRRHDPRARPQGRGRPHEDPRQPEQRRQVLPRRSHRALAAAAARPYRQLGPQGHRRPGMDRRAVRRLVHVHGKAGRRARDDEACSTAATSRSSRACAPKIRR